MKIFENIAALKLSKLTAGQLVSTKGGVNEGDGAQAEYLVTAGVSPDDSVSPDLANGNHALYQGVGAVNDLSQTYIFPTVAAMQDSLIEFPDGKIIHLTDRGADFTKITGTGTANERGIIASSSVNQSVSIILTGTMTPLQLGAVTGGVSDNYEHINDLLLAVESNSISIDLLGLTYLSNQTLKNPVTDKVITINGKGSKIFRGGTNDGDNAGVTFTDCKTDVSDCFFESTEAFRSDIRAGIELKGDGTHNLTNIDGFSCGLGTVYFKDSSSLMRANINGLGTTGQSRALAFDAVNLLPNAVKVQNLKGTNVGGDILDVSAGSVTIDGFVIDSNTGRAFKKGAGAAGGVIAIKNILVTNNAYEEQLDLDTVKKNFVQGETVTGGSSGATGVIVAMLGYYKKNLRIKNMVGVFTVGEVVTGTTTGETGTIGALGGVTRPELIGQTGLAFEKMILEHAVLDCSGAYGIALAVGGEIHFNDIQLKGAIVGTPLRLTACTGAVDNISITDQTGGDRAVLVESAASDLVFNKLKITNSAVEGFRSFAGEVVLNDVFMDGVDSRGVAIQDGNRCRINGGSITNISGGNRPWEIFAACTNARVSFVNYTGFPTSQADTVQTANVDVT